ncbi:MAG: hypothetical protein KDA33_05450, partial [Phycisphaerales bacterium]|nr:hypothetical protein [Phycisphaerales bacterium]
MIDTFTPRIARARRRDWALAVAAIFMGLAPANGAFGQAIALRGADGGIRVLELKPDASRRLTAECDLARVTLESTADQTFRLHIEARARVAEVNYPWNREARQAPYVVYYPELMGRRFGGDTVGEWAWRGSGYPGRLFAPLIIIETEGGRRTHLLHAADWPPRRVSVMYSRGRESLLARATIEPSESATFEYRVVDIPGDWRDAVDAYRAWLAPRMMAAHLADKTPDWMLASHGFLNVQLENMPRFSVHSVWRLASRWEDTFQWVQFWGQMSNYAGPSQLASPSRSADEKVGCCLQDSDVHGRYLPQLADWTLNFVSNGSRRAGFYSRPQESPDRVFSSPDNLAALRAWHRTLETKLHGNVHYVDVIGGADFGPPLAVAEALQTLTPDLFIESVDQLMERPSLISGAYQVDDAFPRLGRYLFNKRSMFLGESNGGGRDWGAEHGYRQETRAFLLGAKFDAIHPNDVVREICRLRDEHHWWERRPVYQDLKGIIEPKDGVEATSFDDVNGRRIIVVVRPGRDRPRLEIVEEPGERQLP